MKLGGGVPGAALPPSLGSVGGAGVPRLPRAIVMSSLRDFILGSLRSHIDEQVIKQVWISTHFAVISERRPPRMKGLPSSRPSLLLRRWAVKRH